MIQASDTCCTRFRAEWQQVDKYTESLCGLEAGLASTGQGRAPAGKGSDEMSTAPHKLIGEDCSGALGQGPVGGVGGRRGCADPDHVRVCP